MVTEEIPAEMAMDTGKARPVVVTGARGFIGRTVSRLLHREGYPVIAVDQPATGPAGARLGVGREILVDISDRQLLRPIFQARKIGSIVHLAAILPTAAQRDPVRATQVNVVGSLNLLEMARDFGVRRFVFGSSLSVYGTCPPGQVVSEGTRAAPEDLYGASKLYVEQLGAAYRERFGLQFVGLRIGRVVGVGSHSTTSAWRSQIFEFLSQRDASTITLPYVGSERLLLAHVEDVAKALVALVHAPSPAAAVYNAPCESVVVGDLKRETERLNSKITVMLGGEFAKGNPSLVNWSRFRAEFGFSVEPIFERLARAAPRANIPKNTR